VTAAKLVHLDEERRKRGEGVPKGATIAEIPPEFKWTSKQAEGMALLAGPARHTMLYGGARSGKTFLICSAIAARAIKAPGSRHLISRFRFNHVKTSIGMDTFPAVMKKRFPGVHYRLDRTDWLFRIGDSEIWLGGLDDKERTEKILGQEYASIYFNECSQISFQAVLMARTRLAQKTKLINRAYYDCNPAGTKHWTSLIFVSKKDPASKPLGQPLPNPDNFDAMLMNPEDNRENLPPEFIAELMALPERQRNRFFLGKFTAELDNALWTPEVFTTRLKDDRKALAEKCDRIVVAVDPSGASGKEDERSDEIGIVAAGRFRGTNRYVVLADITLRASPAVWGRAAVDLYRDLRGDAIVAERNFGGAMVQHTIKSVDTNVIVREVVASRGKTQRAEPVSTLYAQGRVDHVEGLVELEDQMCNMTTAGYMGERSPDRVDAAVWALSDLSQGARTQFIGVF